MYRFSLYELNFKRHLVVVIIACAQQTKKYQGAFRNESTIEIQKTPHSGPGQYIKLTGCSSGLPKIT